MRAIFKRLIVATLLVGTLAQSVFGFDAFDLSNLHFTTFVHGPGLDAAQEDVPPTSQAYASLANDQGATGTGSYSGPVNTSVVGSMLWYAGSLGQGVFTGGRALGATPKPPTFEVDPNTGAGGLGFNVNAAGLASCEANRSTGVGYWIHQGADNWGIRVKYRPLASSGGGSGLVTNQLTSNASAGFRLTVANATNGAKLGFSIHDGTNSLLNYAGTGVASASVPATGTCLNSNTTYDILIVRATGASTVDFYITPIGASGSFSIGSTVHSTSGTISSVGADPLVEASCDVTFGPAKGIITGFAIQRNGAPSGTENTNWQSWNPAQDVLNGASSLIRNVNPAVGGALYVTDLAGIYRLSEYNKPGHCYTDSTGTLALRAGGSTTTSTYTTAAGNGDQVKTVKSSVEALAGLPNGSMWKDEVYDTSSTLGGPTFVSSVPGTTGITTSGMRWQATVVGSTANFSNLTRQDPGGLVGEQTHVSLVHNDNLGSGSNVGLQGSQYVGDSGTLPLLVFGNNSSNGPTVTFRPSVTNDFSVTGATSDTSGWLRIICRRKKNPASGIIDSEDVWINGVRAGTNNPKTLSAGNYFQGVQHGWDGSSQDPSANARYNINGYQVLECQYAWAVSDTQVAQLDKGLKNLITPSLAAARRTLNSSGTRAGTREAQ